ncbi:MAG: acyl-CoA dehydratase activase, partial [Candidatus Aerophobetes bacterium]|nr:acyl-CoA dehydratase activase [Candidatus Aerophobetes bacterium]
GLNIENEFAEEALKSANPARLAGRCAVFAKTDMIHLQQKATPNPDITMGLCEALARSYKSSIARGKDFIPPISFQGGVAANKAMVAAFKKVLKKDEVIVPEHYYSMGALGAALSLSESDEKKRFDLSNLEKEFSLRKESEVLPKLSLDYQEKNSHFREKRYKFNGDGELIDAYIGIDIGSVSTNVAVIDEQKHLLAKSYLPTAGKPIDAVQKGLREVRDVVGGKVKIKGAGTTGSGRYMIGAFVGADVIKNEITAQAEGALNVDPNVDTIFEVGGQDSKYISLDNSVIVDFTMNKACAAGTGSFLEEQAEGLKINIKKEFERTAFSSGSPANLGDRCTVFMESSLFEHLQRGVPVPDLVAGLAYSIAYNYLNKVIEKRRIGENIFFQGGTACNKSVVAAFEKILKKKITVPPHNEVLGAIGAAIVAMEEKIEESRFKGFGLSDMNYKMESFECQDCPNHCKVNQVWIKGEEKPLTYGDRCGKYSEKEKRTEVKGIPNLFKERDKLLFHRRKKKEKGRKMGIPRALYNFELFPLWENFFTELGYEV